jgi:hypothetical protein
MVLPPQHHPIPEPPHAEPERKSPSMITSKNPWKSSYDGFKTRNPPYSAKIHIIVDKLVDYYYTAQSLTWAGCFSTTILGAMFGSVVYSIEIAGVGNVFNKGSSDWILTFY